MLLSESTHLVKGLDPVADAFSGTVYSDVVNMEGAAGVRFIIHVGVGATGTSTFTVQACDDTTPSNRTAVAFWYKEITSGDTDAALTAATTSGFTSTAGSSKIIVIDVPASAIASTGYGYVQLKAVESVNDPVLGGILIEQYGLRFAQSATDSTIV